MARSPYTGKTPASFKFKKIIYEKKGYVAQITINRPKVLNCLDLETIREVTVSIKDAGWDDAIAVLVLTGAGSRAFSTGADLEEQKKDFLGNPQDYWKWMGEFITLHEELRNIGKPTIARLNGMVVGGGNELNMSCDLAVAAEHVTIRQVGAARGSVAAAGATQFLPLIVGDRRAREILWLCEPIPAKKALEWGLVNQVVPEKELDAAVDALCAKLFNKLPECFRYTKQQINFWRELSWGTTIGHAKEWLSIHNLSPEVDEGISAFVEKRDVDYKRIRRSTGKTIGKGKRK